MLSFRIAATSALSLVMAVQPSNVSGQEFRTVSVFSPLDIGVISKNKERLKTDTGFAAATASGVFADTVNLDAIPDSPSSTNDQSAVESALKPPPGIIRRTVLHQNTNDLAELFSDAEKDKKITPVLNFDLFTNVHLRVLVNKVRKAADGSTAVSGYVDGMPGSFASLTEIGEDIYGTIKTYDRTYELTPTSKTFTAVVTPTGAPGLSASAVFDTVDGTQQKNTVIDESRPSFPTIEEPVARPTRPRQGNANDVNPNVLDLNGGDDPAKPNPPAIINFVVLYTKAAMDKTGGPEAMNALINAALASLEQSFLASQINIAPIVTHTGMVDYAETGNIEADRDALQAHTTEKLSQVPVIRSTAQANIVALIVENAGAYCGISYIPEDPAISYKDYSYIVVARQCAVSNLSFAHETGHILGARHDLYVDPTENRPLGKNHGIIFKCGDNYCRDIMAYNNYCQEVLNTTCVRVGIWSGKVWSAGQPLPESNTDIEENTQRALRLFGPIVSGYH
jgi:Metallo-peptidase family M12B Reprolysin-like